MANRNLPFSINSLLTDNPQPNQKGAVDLAECFPLIFGAAAAANLPFGLAQLLAKNDENKGNIEEDEGNDEEEEDEDEEMKMKEENEEEIGKEEMDGEEKKVNQIEDVKNAKEKTASICANLLEQQIDLMQFPSPTNGWLFPFARANGGGHPTMPSLPNHQHPSLARFPFLPPSFGTVNGLVKSSPLFPLFGPFPGGICTGPALQSHHQPTQNQHKRKGGQIRFSNEQTDTLENTFDNKKYLNNSERKRLAKALGLSERQVKTWFQNRRAKWRRQAPADSDDLRRSPDGAEMVDGANSTEYHLARPPPPTTFFANFTGLSD